MSFHCPGSGELEEKCQPENMMTVCAVFHFNISINEVASGGNVVQGNSLSLVKNNRNEQLSKENVNFISFSYLARKPV